MSTLLGKRVLVTRAKEQAASLSKQLKEAGAIPVEVPLLQFTLTSNQSEMKQVLHHLIDYTWVVFTSANAVRFFFQLVEEYNIPFPRHIKIAAVGTKTEHVLHTYNRTCDLIPTEFVGESLFEELRHVLTKDDAVLIPRGQLARKQLYNDLKSLNINVTNLTIYETAINEKSKELLLDVILHDKMDVVTFMSPSTVLAFVHLLAGTDFKTHIEKMCLGSIGPITTKEMKKQGLPVHVEADPYTIEGMIEKLKEYDKEEF